ncbi:MAG TPA: helix-turn-helix transcriptional regulator [Bacteroidia bacterium]|nr:helix-turn-helix transcriptional regulator [Bacteroidia bacterium]
MNKKDIAVLLKERRNQLKISQSDLAKEIGVTREYMPAIERGEQNITVDKLLKLINALDLQLTITPK